MILVDTHALIWLTTGAPLSAAAVDVVAAAARSGVVHVSAASAWEAGILATRTRVTSAIIGDARAWFAAISAMPGVRVLPITAEVALAACYLPGRFHRDPGDRWLVATARLQDLTLVTRDRAILAYAAAGHVRAVAC